MKKIVTSNDARYVFNCQNDSEKKEKERKRKRKKLFWGQSLCVHFIARSHHTCVHGFLSKVTGGLVEIAGLVTHTSLMNVFISWNLLLSVSSRKDPMYKIFPFQRDSSFLGEQPLFWFSIIFYLFSSSSPPTPLPLLFLVFLGQTPA